MINLIGQEAKDDLLSRGYSRRQLMRTAILAGGAASLILNPERAFAADAAPARKMIKIGLNECWTGPMPPGLAAAAAILPEGNRYSPNDERGDFIRTVSKLENIPEDYIQPWPGSNEALARSVVAFCSPTKGLVTADPTYETAGRAAAFLETPKKAVPLKADYSHDVRAMLAADPNAGLYYVCSPNNPTGTITPLADIEWLVENKPAGAIVVIDEAYIHFSAAYPNNTSTHLVVAGKDVIIMRTFSKIFGMAGMRMGYAMARPDLLKKLQLHDAGTMTILLPVPAVACATASLTAHDLIEQRRKDLNEMRGMTVEFLQKRNMRFIGPSEANMIMVDWKTKTAKDMQAAFRAQGIEIARPFATWPTVSRITIGSKADMRAFFEAFDKVTTA
jgi:histidinol-phosphate aminotransferase